VFEAFRGPREQLACPPAGILKNLSSLLARDGGIPLRARTIAALATSRRGSLRGAGSAELRKARLLAGNWRTRRHVHRCIVALDPLLEVLASAVFGAGAATAEE